MTDAIGEARLALRALRKAPAFALTAVGTLGLAIGASARTIVALIMRQALVVVAAGLVVGVVGSLVLTRLIANTLFGIEATDPLTFAAVSMLLLAAALVACIVPTWRALRVQPSEVLRYE